MLHNYKIGPRLNRNFMQLRYNRKDSVLTIFAEKSKRDHQSSYPVVRSCINFARKKSNQSVNRKVPEYLLQWTGFLFEIYKT